MAPHAITGERDRAGRGRHCPERDGVHASVRAVYNERIALGHIAAPAEIADAAVFLATHAARYITGHELLVDGGLTINGSVGHGRTRSRDQASRSISREASTFADAPPAVLSRRTADVLRFRIVRTSFACTTMTD